MNVKCLPTTRRTLTELSSTATRAMPLSLSILHSHNYFWVILQDRCFIDWIIFFFSFSKTRISGSLPGFQKNISVFFQKVQKHFIVHCVLWICFHLIYEATVEISCCRFNDFSVLLPEFSSYVKLSSAFWMPFTYLQIIILFMTIYYVNWVVLPCFSSLA